MAAAYRGPMLATPLSRCHTVPAALALLAALCASGCYLTHPPARGVRPDAGRPDTGPPIDPFPDSGFLDAGPDAGRPPDAAPGECAPQPLDFACTDTENAAVPVREAYDLPVYFGGAEACYCGEEIGCRAELADDGVLDLATELCRTPILCEACEPFVEGTCRLPPMGEGVVHVRVNGADAFDLNVSDASPLVPSDECHTYPRDAIGCGWVRRVDREAVDQICVPVGAPELTPVPVETTDFCLPCGTISGPCEVSRAGSNIHIQYTRILSQCDIDCDMDCTLAITECVIPPLPAGGYVVTVDGVPGSVPLRVGGPPEPFFNCLSVPED